MAVVLIAEDRLDEQKVITEVVRRLGHEATVADDGWSALLAATLHRPDLVIADVELPQPDGLQLCRALHENPALTGVPVVLVTATRPHHPAPTGCAAVATVPRPFDLRQLSHVVAEQLATTGEPYGLGTPGVAMPDDPEFVEALLRSTDTGLAACDRAGRLTFYNRGLSEFFGPDAAGVPLAEWAKRFGLRHHDGRPLRADEVPMMRALAGETVRHAGLLAHDRQDRLRWLTVNAHPVRDRDGTIIGAAAAVQDITTSYQARVYESCKTAVLEALTAGTSASTARAEAVRTIGTRLGWSYVRLWVLDQVTDQLQTDATYTAPGEQPPPIPTSFARGEGLAGLCWQRGEPIWVPDIHADASPVLPAVRAGTRFRAAGAVPVRAGKHVTGVMTFFSYDPQEPEPGLAVLLTGVADSIGAHLQQHRADDLARHLAAITEEYVALAGHELRTPLTSITAYTELIAEAPDLPADVRDLVEVVERNSRHLRRLIDQLLDLAALDTGHLRIADDVVDLTTVTVEAVESMREAAAARRIAVVLEAAREAPVRGDADRLRQVVLHLLDNAVKFSPDGSAVTVRLTRKDGAVLLTVADTGVGLPGGRTADLFRRLNRGDNARHKGVPGNGLGLALCYTIVEHHRGTIVLSPNEPQGTTATVRLPASG
ncbi:ATP-binding protein [Actinoplanes sp. URMC 104]|uniref:hybrid sensor histidine kinase/response regulator n=1 Tax=Actinoplanes sp. URMC 104 TaxID=3423409 RepID=UPI003F1A7CFC